MEVEWGRGLTCFKTGNTRSWGSLSSTVFSRKAFLKSTPDTMYPESISSSSPRTTHTKGITFLTGLQAQNLGLCLYAAPTAASQPSPGHPPCPASCQALSTFASCPATSVSWPATLTERPSQSLSVTLLSTLAGLPLPSGDSPQHVPQ